MEVYHYVDPEIWKTIQKKPGDKEVNRALGSCLGPERDEKVIFALLRPRPGSWLQNPHFPFVWERFLWGRIGRLLLEIVLPDEDDGVFVADWGHREGFIERSSSRNNLIPESYRHSSEGESVEAYLLSRVSIKEYLQREKEFSYSLPEVIVVSRIHRNRVVVSKSQPLIEEQLERERSLYGLYIRTAVVQDWVKEIPGLEGWARSYLERGVPPENLSKERA